MSFIADLEVNPSDFNSGLDRARAKMDSFAESVKSSTDKIGSLLQGVGGALSLAFTAPLTAIGIAAYNMAGDFEDALGATDQIFKNSSETMKNWAGDLQTYFGISKQEALEYGNMMGSMLINIGGLTEDQASKQGAKLIELAGDLAAMYGGTTQSAVQALTGALKGNNTMLDNYGMAANDALVKAKALELGLMSQGKEMTLAAKQAATLALIYEQSGAAQGQAAREAEGASGVMRAFKTEISNLTMEIGAHLLPIITPLIDRVKDIVASFRNISPEIQKTIVVIGALAAAIGPLLLGLGTAIKLIPTLITGFSALTGPVGIAVAVISGAAVLIYKNWDKIREYFTTGPAAKMWDSLTDAAKRVWAVLTDVFTKLSSFVSSIWDRIGSNIISSVTSAFNIVMDVVGVAMGFITGTLNVFSALLNGDFSGALRVVGNMFRSVFNSMVDIAANAIASISNQLAGLLKLIGADGLGRGLEDFATKITPVKTETKSLAVATEEAAKASEDQSKAIGLVIPALDSAKEKTRNYREELNAALAGMNLYEGRLAVIATEYAKITDVANKAGASQEEFRVLSDANWVDNAIVRLDKLGKTYDLIKLKTLTNNDLTKVNLDFIPVLRSDVFQNVISSYGKAGIAAAQSFENSIREVFEGGFQDLFINIAEGIGGALGGGENILKAAGSALLSTMGSVMVSLGTMAIKSGIAIEAVKTALTTLQGPVAIAAGVALVAIGSAFRAGAGKLGSSGGGGGYSGASGSTSTYAAPVRQEGAYGQNQMNINITGSIEADGNKLKVLLDNVDNKNKRAGGAV